MEEQTASIGLESTEKERETAMLLHLSSLLGYFFPGVGFVVPIVIWVIKKDDSPYIDAQAKVLFNAWISYAIYMAVCGVLAFILIGFIGMAVVGVVSFIETIRAALRARENAPIKNYLWAIGFFKTA